MTETETPSPEARLNEQEHLRTFLIGRDAPCPACGYNLRDLKGSTCPECGLALTLRVNLQEPALGSFVAGIVGICTTLGFHAIVLLWAMAMLFTYSGAPSLRDLIPLALGLVFDAPILWLWITQRRRVLKLSSAWRWRLALLASIPGAGCAVFFFATVR